MQKFDDTVKEMESQVKELEDDLAEKVEKLDDEGKVKAKALVEKTEEAIRSSIEKVKGIINDVQEDEKLDEFLDKVKAKSMEAVDFTKGKIAELTRKPDEKGRTLEDLGNDIMAEFDKIKESDAFKKTADFLSDIGDKVTEFFEKPEVKAAINKAKTTTVSIAEKGVENLKKALKTEEILNEEEPAKAEEDKPEE
ncbi:MAG: hypothetical protein IKE50_00535 [Erysipelotrichaceae bacterium]|nr:hypothetical protein [Erysipelotrichaceae bacterium]MBR2533256.1 hypothetical protein [Erysipelotrichaceae bacterium]